MSDFYTMLGGISLAVCAEVVLSSLTENESLKKIISACSILLSMYLLLNFSQKYILDALSRFLP